MPSVQDLRRHIDAVDRQIIELLSRRTGLIKQEMAHMDDEEVDAEREHQVLSNWLEEGFDYDLDEAALERVCKAVIELGRKSKDR